MQGTGGIKPPCRLFHRLACKVEETAGEHDILCTSGKLAEYRYLSAVCLVYDSELSLALSNSLSHVSEEKVIALSYLVIVSLVHECEREDSGIDEVSSVDTGKRLNEYSLYAEVERSKCSVLTGRALTVV